jgi:anti-anti-sigma regulatory factor
MATPAAAVKQRPAGRLGSDEFNSATLPVAQEAAVLYAANYADAAIQILKEEIREAAGRANKQAWLMLFDLYQSSQNRKEFDALAMLYTVKWEQSPPPWAEVGEAAGEPRRNQNRERKDFFALKPAAGGDLAGEIERFRAFAEEQGSVRLDVSKVAAITAEEAALLAGAFVHLRKKQLPMWFNNLDSLDKILRAAINEKTPAEQRPYWLLLFEMLILQERMGDFEELGLEYAVAFEMSPPSWEVYENRIAAAAKAAPPPPATAPSARAAPEAGYSLKGVISAASANQLAEMSAHAAARAEVIVDMSNVLRVEFGYMSVFFDAVKAIQLAGKRVILADMNELNAALLEALGVNRYAILVRRKTS